MKKLSQLIVSSILVLSASSGSASAAQSVELIFNGVPSANISAQPATQAFGDWCSGICFPTTQFSVYDVDTGALTGGNDLALYDFQALTPVPEPPSLAAAVAFGLTAFSWLRCRRRNG